MEGARTKMSSLFCKLTTLHVISAVILIFLSLPLVDTTYWDSVYHYQQRPVPDPGSIIKANNEVVVLRGHSVSLDPFNHLLIKVQPGDRCYLTVLGQEPLAQKFGMLSPKKFPCSFKKGDVEYVHFGSQSGGMDCVKLQLRYDTKTDTIVLPLTLRVAVAPNAQRLVTLNQPLVVDKQNGYSNPINSQGLAITFSDSRCVLTPLIGKGGYPRYGSLMNYFPNSQPVDCNVFLNLGVRYKLKPVTGSPKVDFVPFVVERWDNQDRKLQQEHFQFKVIIDGTAVNSPPKPSFISLMMMEVSQFVMTAITADMLAAEDLESDLDDLVFKVISPPEQGIIISTDNPNQPISAFYQRDLRDLKIAFKPPGEDSDSERILHTEFEVVDQEGSTSDPFSFMIVVKPMNTLAPVVTLNAGQFLFEGQSRPLSSKLNLRISDEDNLADVRISVVHGLRHGTLTVLGSQRKFFTPDDLETSVVMYEHDGTETFSDNIVFRMTDGKNEVEFLFPVTIIPQDDEPPVVNVNTGLVMVKGETKQILPAVLSATDVDSENRQLKFILVYPYSSVGQVLLRQPQTPEDISLWRYSDSNHVFERVAVEWYFSDILEGKLYYRYIGPPLTSTITDHFSFRVEDDNNPPNQSGEHIFYIKIHPIDDLAPEQFPGTTLWVPVREYELTILNRDMLHFTDLTSADKDLWYTINFPSFNQEATQEQSFLGHFVLTDNPNTIIVEFTQAQINYGKVAYKPPDQEIGVTTREIQFAFTVKDAAGNLASGRLTIVLQPVNNKPPQMTNTGLNVVSKSTYVIGKDVLDVTDQDTVSENITFTVIQTPNKGVLRCREKDLTTKKIFQLSDIEAGLLVYVHGGSGDSLHDQFKLDVSDGIHHVPITVRVNIRPIEPVIPVVTIHPGTLDITVDVTENGIVKITSEDYRPNAEGISITLKVESTPRFGVIQVNKVLSNIFTLRSLINGAVTYIHTAGEVGPARTNDSFSLTVSGKWIVNGKMIQNVMVHVSIHPVDNSPPVVRIGEQFTVEEGGKNIIKEDNIQARDLDTEIEFILCTIMTQPSFGFVENVSPAPGYEKSRSGIAVSAFTVKDIQLGHIHYVQSVHKGTEPVEDRFTFQCTDGTNFSDRHIFPVIITPANDEEPVVFCREFVVMEGMSLTIDIPILNAIDIDIPKDILEFEIVTSPKHGRIVQHLTNRTDLIVKFRLEQIQAASSIMYEHDGSETMNDTFRVRLTDGKHVVEKQIVVLILPVDDETPRLSVNNGLEVEIGETKIITNRLLKATDLDSLDSNLTFILRQAPSQGFLQRLDQSVNLTNGMNFTQEDIDKALIQYIHTGQGGVRDLLKFDVTDGTNPLVDRYFYITVGAVDKVFPIVINKGVMLPEGGSVILTTDILSTSDLNSPDEHLRFIIIRPPSRGRLECTDLPGIPVTSFTQLQLAGSKIRYVHTSLEEARLDSFEFQVTDGRNVVFRTFRVSITDVDNKRPVLSVHSLVLGQGTAKCITPFELGVEDQDTPHHLLRFSITRGPVHGKILYNSTRSVTTFTKEDLRENLITYKHDGSNHGEDTIMFTVTDGTHAGFYVLPEMEYETSKPQVLTIRISLEERVTLRIVVNRPALSLTVLKTGQLGFRFSRKVLRTVKSTQGTEVRSVDLIYRLTEPPRYGFIRHSDLNNTNTFTQADINDMKIYYILLDGVNATTDVFTFTVEDKEGNHLRPELFRLHWCWVSFEKRIYQTEEKNNLLEITLKRRGYLGETSFVTISTVDGTAVLGQDFQVSPQRQVQFSPGQTRATWRLRVLDDELYEISESFQIVLSDPVLTLLEHPNVAAVELVDLEDESTVFFSQSELKVEEDVGELLIPVHRRGDISQELMVTCYTQQGSARGTSPGSVLSFSDYISRPDERSSVLLFHRGQRESVCRVLIIDDSLYEGQESFNVTLATPMGGRLGAEHPSVHVVILPHRDDEPSVFFSKSVYAVEESAGVMEVQVCRRGSDLSHPTTVTITSTSTQPPSAQAGVDYVAVGLSVHFAPDVTVITVKVLILDDVGEPVLEGPEHFQLGLSMPMNGTLGHPIRALVTIDDSATDVPSVQFAFSEYSVDEADGSIVVIVIRSGDLTQRSEVRCYTRQSSAQAMMDYNERPDTDLSIVTFQPGEREQKCEVTLVDDSEYEEEEELRLVLGISSSQSAARISLGKRRETLIRISDRGDKPVIQFSETRLSVREPRNRDETETVRVSVQRLGDCSRTSIVRVHTRDGSATAGEDYTPVSVELQFTEGQKLHVVEVSVLYDTERETRETFTVHLKPDDNMVADIQNTKVIVHIDEGPSVGGVTFPAVPEVVSLLVYEREHTGTHTHSGHGTHTPPGYPLVCVTACDPQHSRFSALSSLCVSEGVNDTLTEFRWLVGGAERAAVGQLGEAVGQLGEAVGQLSELEASVFMAPVRAKLLDGVYFRAGWKVQCVARAVSVSGQRGLELSSTVVHISTEEGMCQSHTPGVVGAEPFSAHIRYTGSEDRDHPHLVALTISLPHTDGLLPLISTRPLSWSDALSADVSRAFSHRCSNLLDQHEVTTRYGFVPNNSTHTHSHTLWSPSTRRFYSNLDLEACVWTFRAYYDLSELLSVCGGTVSTDRQVNLVQSFVSLRLPLFVSYLYPASSGWMTFDLRTELRLMFVYDTSILWQQGISSPLDTELQGSLYPTSMRINDEGRLLVTFRTEARFRGQFILLHSGSSLQSGVRCVDQPALSFSLSLISTESTFDQPTQTWSFTSEYAVRDYSGSYIVTLVPCVAPPTVGYTNPPVCHPQQPITFSLDVRFQQVSDAVPSEFTLNTRLYLMSKRELWLSDGSMGFGEEADVVFSEGSRIFGRVMVDPLANLGSSVLCQIEKVFLCAGADGYVPKYRPSSGEFGCLADATALVYRLKILDKSSAHTQDEMFGGVWFDAQLAENTSGAEALVQQAGSDGFSFSSAPLFQVAAGRQWYVHVVYTVHAGTGRKRHTRSERDHHAIIPSNPGFTKDEPIGRQNSRGTNLQPISIQSAASALHVPAGAASGLDVDSHTIEETHGNQPKVLMFQAAMVLLAVTVFLTGVTLCVCVFRKRKTQTTKKHTHSLRPNTHSVSAHTRPAGPHTYSGYPRGRQREREHSGNSEV
ncbi:FRAS1-related extracellular matrix protein 2-like [Pangasianodon hypophthalmus]|uniref:FRAS1-related extracellular matrix protein 2-like n=1 Tax=Pangasianodon hypophthalmus TaxID=310915 RepID=UPI00230825B1|nr:FRAS1-related extracellular matrix protein 2-like [Pangasianodon hypophthalmus]